MTVLSPMYKCICSRSSIRKYNAEKKISKEIFLYILKAASSAPSGGNAQPWYFYIISNQKLINDMRDIVKKTFPDSNRMKMCSLFFNAPYLIAVCIDITKRNYHWKHPVIIDTIDDVFDNPDFWGVAASIQNILLAAHSFNIGTCWCKTETKYRKKFEKLLNMKPNHRLVANITLGYYDEKPIPPKRKPLENICDFVN